MCVNFRAGSDKIEFRYLPGSAIKRNKLNAINSAVSYGAVNAGVRLRPLDTTHKHTDYLRFVIMRKVFIRFLLCNNIHL